jgi:hypothetical protein
MNKLEIIFDYFTLSIIKNIYMMKLVMSKYIKLKLE